MEAGDRRINKYLNGAGYCSRREADRLLEAGRVTVEDSAGATRTVGVGDRYFPGERIFVDGKLVEDTEEEKLYLMLNKPKGVICTGDRRIPENIIDFAGLRHYISYAGRLDKDSTGLVLLTNDGDLNDKIMRAANYHEKEYVVRVDRPITPAFLAAMRRGVRIVLDDERNLAKAEASQAAMAESKASQLAAAMAESKASRDAISVAESKASRDAAATAGAKIDLDAAAMVKTEAGRDAAATANSGDGAKAEAARKPARRGLVVTTRPCQVTRLRGNEFSIILTQGYNRQIRRMCKALGYNVLEIRRIRIMNLRLGNLKEGMKRFLRKTEIEELRRMAYEDVDFEGEAESVD